MRLLAERAHVLYLEDVAVLEARARPGEDPVGAVMRDVRLPGRVARVEAGLARALHHPDERQCAATAQLLRDGALSIDQARTIQRTMNSLPAAEVAEVEPLVAQLCAEQAPAATEQICRNARALSPRPSPDVRDARAHAARGLRIVEFGDQVKIEGQVAIPDGAVLLAAVDAFASPAGENDSRTRAQRQADSLVEIARRQLAAGDGPLVGGVRPQVHLTIDLPDLLASDEGPTTATIDRLGAGLGPRAARQLLCDAMVDTTVVARPAVVCRPTVGPATDSDSTASLGPADMSDGRIAALLRNLSPALGGVVPDVLFAGRTSRLVTPAQRRALVIRDRGCAYPGCDRPPPWCEAHHLQHRADGGLTDLPNLALVCSRHHHVLHANGAALVRGPDGRFLVETTHHPARVAA